MYGEIAEVVVFSPNQGCAVACYYWKCAVGYGAGHGSCPGRRLDLTEITLASLWLLWASWCRCGGYRPPYMAWRRAEGPVGEGLAPVKIRTPFEGNTHTRQGFCRGESTRSRQHSGENSAWHICTGYRRFPQGRNSAGHGGTVTGVGRRDSSHSHCVAWWPDTA